jgi:UDP-glucose 4-epimerase
MTAGAAASRRALVTGGAGFIGSHLVERLLADGFAVRVLDDFSSGREENLAAVEDRIELVRGDVCDSEIVSHAVAGVDVVFHQAAIASVPRSVAEPVRTNAVNLEATLGLLEAARRHSVRRLVFAASSAAYGDDPTLPKSESLPVFPLSPYAVQKHASELYLQVYARLHGIETVALRYFNVYGPRQDPKSDYAAVIPLFVTAALEGSPVRIYGDGEQTRDFVFVADVAEANRLAGTLPGVSGAVLNVASGRRTSVNELARGIGECLGRRVDTRHEPPRAGDVPHSWADVSQARRRLGFEARVSLEQGLELTVEDFARGRV